MKESNENVKTACVVAAWLGGFVGGFCLDYTSFFVTTDGLEVILGIPAILLGLLAGLWCWLPGFLFLSMTSLVLFARTFLAIGPCCILFGFGLTILPIWEYWSHTLLAAYFGAFLRMLIGGARGSIVRRSEARRSARVRGLILQAQREMLKEDRRALDPGSRQIFDGHLHVHCRPDKRRGFTRVEN